MFTGTVKHWAEETLASVEADVVGDYLVVLVKIGVNTVVRFPMPADSDINSVEAITANILNQTGLINERAAVKLTES